MDCAMSHSCSCRVNLGCGLSALLLRLKKTKKKGDKGNNMVSVCTQTDEDLIEILVAQRWGERIGNQPQSTRVAPPPPPPDRKRGVSHGQLQQVANSNTGPFAPTLDELLKGKASLRPVKSTPDPVSQSTKGCEDKESSRPCLGPKSSSAPPKNAPTVAEILAAEEIKAN